MDKNIQEAIKILKDGGIVIFPTDTAFGIGCRMDNEDAVRKLFKIRKRSRNKAVPVLAESIDMIREYVKGIPQDVEKLMEKYWPGGITIILRCNRVKVPSLVRGGGENLGIRIPDNKIIKTIISKVGKPILAPSANFSGDKTPYRFEELDKKLVELADFVISGATNGERLASTVLDCTVKPWKIIREGVVHIPSL